LKQAVERFNLAAHISDYEKQKGIHWLHDSHAALPAEEMKKITGSWEERATESRLFAKDPEIRQLLQAQQVKRIGYRVLRDLQRKR
jgi:hypothetical protein